MTVRELLTYIESVKPHVFPDSALLLWLNELEGRVQLDIFLMAPEETVEYTLPDDNETVLLVDLPHTGIYRYWLEAMIDFESGEYNQYQNSVELFNNAWNEFACWFAETQGTEGDGVSRGFYLSAYGIAVKHGYTGSEEEWLETLKGAPGEDFKYEDFTEEQLAALREGVVQDAIDQARDHAQAAEESARAAENSKTTAEEAATAAEESARAAEASKTDAGAAATAAASAREQAYSYMDSARNSATKAAESVALAEQYKDDASASRASANHSARDAVLAAEAAGIAQAAAEEAVSSIGTSVADAADSAAAAKESEAAAEENAEKAEAAQTAAAGSAEKAAKSEQSAGIYSVAAAESFNSAKKSETAAQAAQTAAEAAQAAAEKARDDAENAAGGSGKEVFTFAYGQATYHEIQEVVLSEGDKVVLCDVFGEFFEYDYTGNCGDEQATLCVVFRKVRSTQIDYVRATENGWDSFSEEFASGSGGDGTGVLIATYGVTTFAEIATAVAEGKSVEAVWPQEQMNRQYQLQTYSDVYGMYIFTSVDSDGYVYNVGVDHTGAWTNSSTGVGSDEAAGVFIAAYGKTTYNEVLNAVDEGKLVAVKRWQEDGTARLYYLDEHREFEGKFLFTSHGSDGTAYKAELTGNEWTNVTVASALQCVEEHDSSTEAHADIRKIANEALEKAPLVVTANWDDGNILTNISHTSSEIIEAHAAGRTVVLTARTTDIDYVLHLHRIYSGEIPVFTGVLDPIAYSAAILPDGTGEFYETHYFERLLPTVSAEDNGKFLRVVNGAWAKVALTDVSEVGA